MDALEASDLGGWLSRFPETCMVDGRVHRLHRMRVADSRGSEPRDVLALALPLPYDEEDRPYGDFSRSQWYVCPGRWNREEGVRIGWQFPGIPGLFSYVRNASAIAGLEAQLPLAD